MARKTRMAGRTQKSQRARRARDTIRLLMAILGATLTVSAGVRSGWVDPPVAAGVGTCLIVAAIAWCHVEIKRYRRF